MRKLRNIGYLRFGSKIRQGFAGGIISLTPPLSLSPLWISWTGNKGAREGAQLLYLGGSLPPPCRAGGLPAAPPPGGRCLPPDRGAAGSCQGPPCKKIYVYSHVGPCRPPQYY